MRHRPVEQALPERRLPRHLGQDAHADHLQHPRHRGQDRWTDRQHVGRQMLDPAGIDDLGAEAEQEELPDGVLVAVRDRQVGQVDLVVEPERPHQSNAPGQLDRMQRCGSITPRGAPPVPEV